MENIQDTYLLQLVHLNSLTIEITKGGGCSCVNHFDHFMMYVQALVTSSQAAKCTAQGLWDQFIVHYGLPKSIISDHGRNFGSDLIPKLWKLAKVWKLHTSPYHPQTNGQCEWFNSTLINMLCTLPPNKCPAGDIWYQC